MSRRESRVLRGNQPATGGCMCYFARIVSSSFYPVLSCKSLSSLQQLCGNHRVLRPPWISRSQEESAYILFTPRPGLDQVLNQFVFFHCSWPLSRYVTTTCVVTLPQLLSQSSFFNDSLSVIKQTRSPDQNQNEKLSENNYTILLKFCPVNTAYKKTVFRLLRKSVLSA